MHARVVDEVARGEIIATIDDDVVPVEDIEHIVCGEAGVVGVNLHVGVEVVDGFLCRFDL